MIRNRWSRRGTAMVEAGLCLALFTPIVVAGLRLAYGANQMHQLADTVDAAARAAGACASQEQIRRIATDALPGLPPDEVEITINRATDPAMIRVAIHHVQIVTLAGAEPMHRPASAGYPYLCD